MTYLQFINKIRVELKDFPRLRREKFDGDGDTTIFQVSDVPIKDGSYTVEVGGVAQVEETDFTVDKDTGEFTFTSAPDSGSDNVDIIYKSVKIRDEDYLEIINDGIDYFRWKFWTKEIDDSTLTTTANKYEIDMSSLTGILYVVRADYKTSSSATYWQAISGLTNWRYLTQSQKLRVDPPFSTSSLPLKFEYLKSITKGSTTSATLNIPTEWLLPYKYYVYSRYYERLVPEKIHDTSAVTTQPAFTPAQATYNISAVYMERAEKIANRIAPKLPPMPIKNQHEGATL